MLDWIFQPLSYTFMLQGIMAGCLAALACSSLSVFVVWRRMSFIGDAVAHAVLPGVVLSYVLKMDFLWGALGGALLMVLAIGYISQRMDMHEDAAIGVVFAGFFSLGILAMSRVSTLVDLSHILFGNILGVSTGDLVLMGSLTLVVLIALAVCYKEIVMASFDPSHAAAIGLSPVLVRYILLILIALTTVLSIRVVGVVLVLALLVTPAAAASFLTGRIKRIIFISILIAQSGNLGGFYASYYMDLPSGPTIVLILSMIFVVCGGISRFVRK